MLPSGAAAVAMWAPRDTIALGRMIAVAARSGITFRILRTSIGTPSWAIAGFRLSPIRVLSISLSR